MGRKKLGPEEYLLRLEDKFGGIWTYDDGVRYTGSNDRVKVRHSCGYITDKKASYILTNGCVGCRKDNRARTKAQKAEQERQKKMDAKKKRFQEKLDKEKPGEYLVLKYTGTHDPSECIHLPCGNIRTLKEARNYLRRDCPYCTSKQNSQKRMQRIWDEKAEMLESVYRVQPIGRYKGKREKMAFMCLDCGKTIISWPENILNGRTRCDHVPEEEKEKQKLFQQAIILLQKELKRRQKEERIANREKKEAKIIDYFSEVYDVLALDPEVDRVLLRCKRCRRLYPMAYDYALQLSRKNLGACRDCSRQGYSKGVKDIMATLELAGVDFDREVTFTDCIDQRRLPFDFGIRSDSGYKALIEFDGEQHFRATTYMGGNKKLNSYKRHDAIKTEWCKNKNIPLLRVMWNDGNIPETVKSFVGGL